MITIGLTGSFGSGKSTVARMFARYGAVVIDADAIVHEELKINGKAYARVAKVFGKSVVLAQGINRRLLADIVFRDPKKLKQLTAIVHPIVLKEVQARIRKLKKESKVRMVVVDAPLLIEAGWDRWVDYLIVVKASLDLQIRRLSAQRKITKAEIFRRLKSQLPIRQKISMADIVIDNRMNLKETQKQTYMIVQRLLLRFS